MIPGMSASTANIQYSVPCELPQLGRADRDLEGVRKCLLHAVWQAQGKGCSPGAIGVCIGGDRASGYAHAKQQLFRSLDDVNADPALAELEATIMKTVNVLGIGTMGFGGATSLIGCKVGVLNRLPASYFVSVAYDCWAFRRLGVVLDAKDGSIRRWLYRDPSTPAIAMLDLGYVNDPAFIKLNPKVCAINGALEVDLTGQVCADSIGDRQYSGVGGQMDFIRGAALSEGGKPIIALPSVTSAGESRIVSVLKPAAGVVTTRAHVHFVVTEHGIADLFGKNLRQRAAAGGNLTVRFSGRWISTTTNILFDAAPTVAPPTPGASNSVAATLPAFRGRRG